MKVYINDMLRRTEQSKNVHRTEQNTNDPRKKELGKSNGIGNEELELYIRFPLRSHHHDPLRILLRSLHHSLRRILLHILLHSLRRILHRGLHRILRSLRMNRICKLLFLWLEMHHVNELQIRLRQIACLSYDRIEIVLTSFHTHGQHHSH